MIEFKPLIGTSINVAAKDLYQFMLRTPKKEAFMMFNDVKVIATIKSNPSSLYDYWVKESDRKQKEYLASDEYKESEKQRILREERLENLKKRLMVQLESKNFFRSPIRIIDWFCKMEPCFEIDGKKIVEIFEANGYYPGVNTGKDFDINSLDNHSRYIIGQCLVTLKSKNFIHQVVNEFAKDLKLLVKKKITK